jgi:hypothetical protein
MPSEGIAGVDSYLLYGEESTLGTAGTPNKHFGLVRSFNAEANNNTSYRRGFKGSASGGRDVAKPVYGAVSHSLSVDLDVINWAFLEYVLGAVSGSDPYTYTGSNTPASLTVAREIVNPGAASDDQDRQWLGCLIDSATIRCTVGEPVTVSLSMIGANSTIDTTVVSNVALPSGDLYTFAGASIELPNGTSLPNIIDSVEITITNNAVLVPGLGSRLGKAGRHRARDYKLRFTVKYLDNDLITAVLGAVTPDDTTEPTEFATIEFTFEQGSRSAEFLFSNFVFDSHAGSEEANEWLTEDLSGTAYSLTVTEDNT